MWESECRRNTLTNLTSFVRIDFKEKLVDALKSAELCVDKYRKTGNTEYLCNAANYLMFEFMYPQVPGVHFTATDSKDSAGKPIGPLHEHFL